MNKGCSPYMLGLIVLVIIFSVLAKGDDEGAEGLIKFCAFVVCIAGVIAIINLSSKK